MQYCFWIFFLLVPGLLIAQNDSGPYRAIEVRFENGEEHTVVITDEDPRHVSKGNFVFEFLNLGILQEGVMGPVSAGLKYQRVRKANKNILDWEAFFIPVDSRFLEKNASSEMRFFTSWGEFINKNYFFSRQKEKNRRLNFMKGYDTRTNYRVRFGMQTQRNYGVRYGLRVGQNTTSFTDAVVLNDQTTRFRLHAQRYACVALGLSTSKMVNVSYSSDSFGRRRAQLMSEFYIDFLISPWLRAYGTFWDDRTSDSLFVQRPLQMKELKNLPTSYIGVRIGGHRRSSWLRSKSFGGYYHYEVAYYPGMVPENISITFGYGVTLFGKKRGTN